MPAECGDDLIGQHRVTLQYQQVAFGCRWCAAAGRIQPVAAQYASVAGPEKDILYVFHAQQPPFVWPASLVAP